VTNRTSGTVSVIRTSDNAVIGSVKVGTSPESMALNITGTRLYVANYGSSNVSVVDVSGTSPSLITNVAVGAYPRGIAFATVNGQPRVYVTRYTSSSVAVIDATTNKQIDVNPSTSTVDSIKVGANPQAITVSADGTRAYVTNYGSNSVSVINTTTNTVDGSAISVGTKPAEHEVGVGDGRILSALRVTRGSGYGARAARADAQAEAAFNPCNGAAPRADRHHVERGYEERMRTDAAAIGERRSSLGDEGHVGAGPAHVERDEVAHAAFHAE